LNIDGPLKSASLDHLFNPQSIAIIGASENMNRIGGRPIRYLLENNYKGNIYPINPKYERIGSLICYPDLDHVPGPVDLAIIALPGNSVIKMLKQCAKNRVKSIVIFSAGFAEIGEAGKDLQDEIIKIANEHNIRILGPNCLGMFNNTNGVFATFASSITDGAPSKGRIGLITQSGAVGSHVFTLARERNIGFNYWVSTGNESDIDIADCIAYLAGKEDVDVIACYLEGAKDGIKLLHALNYANKCKKPIVILKTGSSDAGKAAVQSHTASLVGSDMVYDTIFKQFGAFRVHTIEEFINIAYACTILPLPKGKNVGVFSVSGGVGILLADQVIEHSLNLPEPSLNIKDKLLEKLPFAGVRNPFDITAQVINQPSLLKDFMDIVFSNGIIDIGIVFLAHLGLSTTLFNEQLEALKEMKKKHPNQPFIVVTLTKNEIRKRFNEEGMLVCEDPTQAVKIIEALIFFRDSLLSQPQLPLGHVQRKVCFPNSSKILTEFESKKILKDYGIPCTQEYLATTINEAKWFSEKIGYPVVLKGMSTDVLHKTDNGLVHLKLENSKDVEAAYSSIIDKMSEMGVAKEGVLIQEWVNMDGLEVIVGSKNDPVFGQMVVVGLGGIYTEVFNDISMRKAPISIVEAENMLKELRSYRLFHGYRNQKPLDILSLCKLVSQFSHFLKDHKNIISEIDLNPVVVLPRGSGVITVDALIKLH
jgi:acetate---CoA ligase (ADP-forming)